MNMGKPSFKASEGGGFDILRVWEDVTESGRYQVSRMHSAHPIIKITPAFAEAVSRRQAEAFPPKNHFLMTGMSPRAPQALPMSVFWYYLQQ